VCSFEGVLFSATRGGRAVRFGSNSEAERSPGEETVRVHPFELTGARGNTSKTDPERGKGHGGFANPYGDTADFGKTLKGAQTAREEAFAVVTRRAQLEPV
jgi:hypothetical protein